MPADTLVTFGARASTGMVFTQKPENSVTSIGRGERTAQLTWYAQINNFFMVRNWMMQNAIYGWFYLMCKIVSDIDTYLSYIVNVLDLYLDYSVIWKLFISRILPLAYHSSPMRPNCWGSLINLESHPYLGRWWFVSKDMFSYTIL